MVGDSDPEVFGSGGCGSNGVVAITRDAPFMHVHGTGRRPDALGTRRAVPVQGSRGWPGEERRWRLPGAAGWPDSCGADRRGTPWRGPQWSSRPCSDRRGASCDPPLAEHGSGSISRRRQPRPPWPGDYSRELRNGGISPRDGRRWATAPYSWTIIGVKQHVERSNLMMGSTRWWRRRCKEPRSASGSDKPSYRTWTLRTTWRAGLPATTTTRRT